MMNKEEKMFAKMRMLIAKANDTDSPKRAKHYAQKLAYHIKDMYEIGFITENDYLEAIKMMTDTYQVLNEQDTILKEVRANNFKIYWGRHHTYFIFDGRGKIIFMSNFITTMKLMRYFRLCKVLKQDQDEQPIYPLKVVRSFDKAAKELGMTYQELVLCYNSKAKHLSSETV